MPRFTNPPRRTTRSHNRVGCGYVLGGDDTRYVAENRRCSRPGFCVVLDPLRLAAALPKRPDRSPERRWDRRRTTPRRPHSVARHQLGICLYHPEPTNNSTLASRRRFIPHALASMAEGAFATPDVARIFGVRLGSLLSKPRIRAGVCLHLAPRVRAVGYLTISTERPSPLECLEYGRVSRPHNPR